MSLTLTVLGLVLLIAGADLLVRGAARLARAFGMPPLVIGLTLVACGTSAPELAVSVSAATTGSGDVALGNVLGSNVFNVLLILGIGALLAPLAIDRNVIRRDVPVLIVFSLGALGLAFDGEFGRLDGGLLLVGAAAYTWDTLRRSRRETERPGAGSGGRPPRHVLVDGTRILLGLGLLVLGSRWFVSGAVSIARDLHVSELVIGLTIVAGGTSLPELATSAIAAIRGERDIAVGNVIGSNIFNLTAVLGLASVVAPDGIAVSARVLQFDLPVMVATSVVCAPLFFTGAVLSRGEGGLLLGLYAAYLTHLVLDATRSAALEAYHRALLLAVIPATAVVLGILTVRARSRRRRTS